jgi:hypothetical protein
MDIGACDAQMKRRHRPRSPDVRFDTVQPVGMANAAIVPARWAMRRRCR